MKNLFKKDGSLGFIYNSKFQWTLVLLTLLFIICLSSYIRLQNLELLVDTTTGKNIPLALDPFYFLRLAEVIQDNGSLPAIDSLRKPFDCGFSYEILPQAIVLLYKVISPFSEVTIQFVDIISPVIFYVLGLIAFFFLVLLLTNSKLAAISSSIILAFIPSYLYRTMAGFSDHESIGMFAFLFTLLFYTIAMKYLEKNKEQSIIKVCLSLLFGLILGTLLAFTFVCWTGIVSFLLMIIPFSFLLFWLFELKKDIRLLHKEILFYLVTYILSIFILLFKFNIPVNDILSKYFIGINGFVSLFVIGIICIDYLFILFLKNFPFKINEDYRVIYSGMIAFIIGSIFLSIKGILTFNFVIDLITKFLHPFGAGRVGLTVAENQQPYLLEWINNVSKEVFWMFFLGLLAFGFEISRKIRDVFNKNLFLISWGMMICGILFSRIASGYMFDGESILSKVFYIGSLIFFLGSFIYIYFKDEIHFNISDIILMSFSLFMLLAARGALRLFFVITPLVCIMVGYLLYFCFKYFKEIEVQKDKMLKNLFGILFIILFIISLLSLNNFYTSSSIQAKYTGPSANIQWQNAMSWVRENTTQESVFAHWWDYGYWVQSLGERPTIADGGHFQGSFRDHMIGRYILTTPKPDTALSFMKTNNVSYLLIDQTDLGKYGAYSKIGSDGTYKEGVGYDYDRFSFLPLSNYNPSKVEETYEDFIRHYQFGVGIDEDIIYKNDKENEIFLPGPSYDELGNPLYQSALIDIKVITTQNNLTLGFKQPKGVYVYKDILYEIPLRYLYFNNELLDFKTGLNAGVQIIPLVTQTNRGISLDEFGTVIYLSPKVFESLFTQLYLLDDPLNRYPTINLSYEEKDYYVNALQEQGTIQGSFINYNGFRGSIKIWEIDYSENILEKEEFLRKSGEYAEFDNLVLTK